MFDSLDDLCIGKTISLEKAAQKLGEIDGDHICQRWTLRFCLSKYVKVCIKLPSPVLTWEREKEPDYDSNIPIMGLGDYIDQRSGVLFIPHETVKTFTYSDTDEVSCSRFYVRDESWQSGFKEVEIASEKHYLRRIYKDELDEPPETDGYLKKFQDEIGEYIESASDDDSLIIDLKNLYIWKEDFISALTLDDDITMPERRVLPMHSSDSKNLKGKPEQQKEWMQSYLHKNLLNKNKPLTDEQLQIFRQEAYKVGMTGDIFKTRRRELGIKGEDKNTK